MRDCPACGASVSSSSENCPECGVPIKDATASFEPVVAQAPAAGGQHVDAEGPVLVVRKGPQPGEEFFIDRSPLTIGRDPGSDIFLNDMTVSRSHALLERVGDEVTVRDSGSLNGTYINGVCVDAAQLHTGDVLQIGTFQMMFIGASGGGLR